MKRCGECEECEESRTILVGASRFSLVVRPFEALLSQESEEMVSHS